MSDEHEQSGEETGEEPRDPEREARRLLALAQIRQYPDPVLRMQGQDVEQFDDELRRLGERLTSLMVEADGAGLAATQIGVLRRIFVFRHTAADESVVLVNPEVAERSEEVEMDDEGCLSLQGVLVPVERHVHVTVAAKDVAGADVRLELEGFDARACQHELDHLDGVLIIDRTDDASRRAALATLRPQPVLGAR